MEEEEAPILRLEILQGPRQGETLDFKPGSAVRIGRVVKGNTLPIKDPGISSKHLSILNESAKWILRDLDSSNGTALDASRIPPNTPFPLHHDSSIKIGEFTSIHVIFLPPQQQQHTLPPRRNPSRRGRTAPVPASVPVAPSEPARPRGRPRGRRVMGMDKVQVQVQSVDEKDASVVNVEYERVDPPARVKRKSNRERSVVKESSVENLIRAEEKVEEPKITGNPNLFEISDSNDENLDASVVKEPKNARGIRHRKNTRGVTANIENVEKKTKRGVAGKRELDKEGEDRNGVKEACDGKEKGNLNEDDGNWLDLNKMTLGEWFDFLEFHLPKQIIDETEEMIGSMTQKAERLREYIAVMQQHNVKGKMPIEK
ncbi:unnamed protein product [Sphenostylis stenocarpa]|uniref:FHA domain-containing protein n=1 Tax=Sphenostylis stenocarpa TaxID=92480 RepID=A0AA86VB08_9FABA|nr:unnamed protein product [Sphenostylis stenocarpa]